jgi:putative ABC transport system permease protein
VASRLSQTPGVESAAVSGWTFLSGNNWVASVRVPNRAAVPRPPYFLDVSAGFFEAMRIGFIDGRDFRPGDVPPLLINGQEQPAAGVGIVNKAFAHKYFDGRNAVGSLAYVRQGNDGLAPMRIVGYVNNAVYSSLREPLAPVVYVPIGARDGATLIVRTAGDPNALAPMLRLAVPKLRSGFRVRNIGLQSALVRRQMIRERLLAALSFFFAFVALVLAATGLYGVLNHSVIRQRREIGIRTALGDPSGHVVGHVTAGILAMVCLGSIIGLAGGLSSVRFVQMLLYEVKATDARMVVAPILTLFGAATFAALPPVIRAVNIDPAQTLRNE